MDSTMKTGLERMGAEIKTGQEEIKATMRDAQIRWKSRQTSFGPNSKNPAAGE
jgi:hypothetical protein